MTSGTALVRRPSSRLAEGLLTHLERSPVDYELALRQWDGYVQAFRDAGWKSNAWHAVAFFQKMLSVSPEPPQ